MANWSVHHDTLTATIPVVTFAAQPLCTHFAVQLRLFQEARFGTLVYLIDHCARTVHKYETHVPRMIKRALFWDTAYQCCQLSSADISPRTSGGPLVDDRAVSRVVGGGFSSITGLRTAPQKKSAPFHAEEWVRLFLPGTSTFSHHYRRSLHRTNQRLPGTAVQPNVTFRDSLCSTARLICPWFHFVLSILH
jgi:hypothetical protein